MSGDYTNYVGFSQKKYVNEAQEEREPDYPKLDEVEPQIDNSITHVDDSMTHVIPDEAWYKVINCSSVNVRAKPTVDSKSLQIIRAGWNVKILDIVGDWVQIETELGTIGYLMGKYIQV